MLSRVEHEFFITSRPENVWIFMVKVQQSNLYVSNFRFSGPMNTYSGNNRLKKQIYVTTILNIEISTLIIQLRN